MHKFLDSLRRLFQRQPVSSEKVMPANTNADGVMDEKSVVTLMELIEKTNEDEYSCEETYALLDEYVELVADGQDVEKLMPLVKKHVDHCPDCGPRFEILLDILQNA
jgi:hypothetical protein